MRFAKHPQSGPGIPASREEKNRWLEGRLYRSKQMTKTYEVDADKINVDLFSGPAGSCGFRKGTWTAEYEGKTYKFFSSVPHGAELDAQERLLKQDAARHIAATE